MSTPSALRSIFDNSEQRESGFRENSSQIFSSDKTDEALYWGGECVSLSEIAIRDITTLEEALEVE
ncbi:hypothetical protein TWF788_008180 [Orbilia oligospora]|uniref:Uncharacterized protein n=1 Tax=Orbilia oligospora TaxID=2813651 RepID=A0A7C8Q2M2_ORBOL|nr:hypothetical protein TWF788_008180 [Orbilia oligospora]